MAPDGVGVQRARESDCRSGRSRRWGCELGSRKQPLRGCSAYRGLTRQWKKPLPGLGNAEAGRTFGVIPVW